LAYVLKQSDARVLFLADEFRRSNFFAILNEAIPQLSQAKAEALELAEFPRLDRIIAMKGSAPKGLMNWNEFAGLAQGVKASALKTREAELKPGDPINIQYTSGTTGFPKGAMLTHRNLLLNAFYTGDCQNYSEQDRVCVPVPFYHCFGCVLGVLAAAVHGAAMIVPAEYFDPLATLDAIEQERATSLYGVPTMFIAQLEHPTFSGRDLTSLRTGIMAGSPCPIEVMKRVVSDMGAKEITIGYGQTEASPIITQSRTNDPLQLRVQTVGRPIPNIEVKLVDPETGNTLGDNVQGELCTRGHIVMLGYYNNPEGTKSAIDSEGWLHTGDLALRQPDGYYRITGRIRDMICRGGENIYPREIEEFLYTHPAVQDVAIVGVPDPKFVEEVAAWIRLKDNAQVTEEEIKQYCKANLAHYKVPKYVKFVTEFPQTVTGKIQKFRIRELIIEELNLKVAETA
jgi:fatty-acyl-CoA synthase